MCSILLCLFDVRYQQINKNVVPTKTWIPWNPVAIKNVHPYEESLIENEACQYSTPWRMVKYTPREQVKRRDMLDTFILFRRNEWCLHVIEIPDESKIIVFSKGTFIGLNASILWGGQFWPISMHGLILAWKYAQKKDTKNKISEVINRIIPILSPSTILLKWDPCLRASRTTSFHQKKAVAIRIVKAGIEILIDFKENLLTINEVDSQIDNDVRIGHGLRVIIWKLWNLFNIYLMYLSGIKCN